MIKYFCDICSEQFMNEDAYKNSCSVMLIKNNSGCKEHKEYHLCQPCFKNISALIYPKESVKPTDADEPIECLIEYSTMIYNALKRAGYNTIGDILQIRSRHGFINKVYPNKKIINFGEKSLSYLLQIMREKGFDEWVDKIESKQK